MVLVLRTPQLCLHPPWMNVTDFDLRQALAGSMHSADVSNVKKINMLRPHTHTFYALHNPLVLQPADVMLCSFVKARCLCGTKAGLLMLLPCSFKLRGFTPSFHDSGAAQPVLPTPKHQQPPNAEQQMRLDYGTGQKC